MVLLYRERKSGDNCDEFVSGDDFDWRRWMSAWWFWWFGNGGEEI